MDKKRNCTWYFITLLVLAFPIAFFATLLLPNEYSAQVFEINQIPDQIRKEDTLGILNLAKKTVELNSEIETLAREFEFYGIKTLDALHLSFASFLRVDYFCTYDDNFMKKAKRLRNLNIKVVSPTELVMELEL